MGRRPSRIDALRAAVQALRAAGIEPRVDIQPDGCISVVPGNPGKDATAALDASKVAGERIAKMRGGGAA